MSLGPDAYEGFTCHLAGTESAFDGTETATQNLWCGLMLCEQRHSNETVMARYFPQGEVKNDTVYFYATDQIGSVVAMIKKDGTVAGRTRYGPYGQIISQSGIQPGFAYARLYHDTASGLDLATFRAYDPQTGHWLKRDPIREAGGINLYAYVMGNPIRKVDIFGLLNVCGLGACTGDLGGPQGSVSPTLNPPGVKYSWPEKPKNNPLHHPISLCKEFPNCPEPPPLIPPTPPPFPRRHVPPRLPVPPESHQSAAKASAGQASTLCPLGQ